MVAPAAESHRATWWLVSAGFDAHRADPLTGLGLAAGDYADMTARVRALAAPGRLIAAEKANTANLFNLDAPSLPPGTAPDPNAPKVLSTANLFSALQPGGVFFTPQPEPTTAHPSGSTRSWRGRVPIQRLGSLAS